MHEERKCSPAGMSLRWRLGRGWGDRDGEGGGGSYEGLKEALNGDGKGGLKEGVREGLIGLIVGLFEVLKKGLEI